MWKEDYQCRYCRYLWMVSCYEQQLQLRLQTDSASEAEEFVAAAVAAGDDFAAFVAENWLHWC